MGFAEELYRLRKEAGLSQKELANKIGVSQASINYWEKGQRTPSISMVTLITDYFNVSLENLLTRNEHAQLEEHEQKQREEAAKKAPKFVSYDEKGNRITTEKAPKFTEPSMSKEEAIAEAEAEELERLQAAYKRLNRKGKTKAVERVEELTEIPRYTKKDKDKKEENTVEFSKELTLEKDYLLPNAAHDRTDIEVTEEMKKHDDAMFDEL